MVRLIPSADWQPGARFAQYGAAAERRCAVRLTTFGDTLARAVNPAADALLTVEITPEHKTTLRVDGASTPRRKTLIAGRKARRQQPRSLDFHQPGWIRSGAWEVQTASTDFAGADAHVVVSQAEVLPDFEKLPECNRRAAASPQQFANELISRRTDRDQAKAVIQTLGGQGLYSRETELMERRDETELRRDAARAQGWSARVAHDLIEHRKRAATKAVLTPLEHRLTSAFAELTGDTTRQVFLDERLPITGIGRTRDSAYAFGQLSQGAKEQRLLCLRLAVAQELATDEPQVLIFDDVLVNTDLARQDRILDVLGTQAARLQILILTCHPDRYRGIGQSVVITH